ncbi:SDR family NAD(P)-dependent oxidoreductase [candidate division KSB1 bacterium]|nr:SDR family NAD(P)-dependent oxidoreductase [candidate division KSB1 bacterium]
MDLKQLSGKRILITGGLGFIGSNLSHRLVQHGADVRIFDAKLDPYGWNETNIREIRSQVELIVADVRDEAALERALQGCDLVYHLAAQVGREISMEDPELDTAINCNGTLNLCRILSRIDHPVKVVYAGSRGQIGEPVYLPVDEEHPTLPTDVYGINKLCAEKYLLLFGRVNGFPAVSLRLNNVYGPRCQMHHGFYGILNWFIRNAMADQPITVYGDGLQTRDYVYIDDVVDGFVRAGLMPQTDNQIYFIGSGTETVFLDMVREVISAVGQGSFVHVPFPPQRENIDIRKFVVTTEKFRRDTGWTPQTDLAEGVRRTVTFYRQRLDDYLAKEGAPA